MLRAFASAVQGLGVIIGITAAVPWLFMPNEADWAALGFGSVMVLSAIMTGLGAALHYVLSLDRSARRAGAAPQVVIVTPQKGGKRRPPE